MASAKKLKKLCRPPRLEKPAKYNPSFQIAKTKKRQHSRNLKLGEILRHAIFMEAC